MVICSYVYAHSWSPNDGNRNQQNSQLLSLFLLQHVLILVSNPINQYNISLLASFFQVGERNQQNKQP